MQVKKNNFKNYQSEKVAKRLILIEEQVEFYKKKKTQFKNITEMAESLAEHIAKREDNSCSSSTILRNDKYKQLIESYFYSQPGMKNSGIASSFIAELTVSNVERENIRLKSYVSTLQKELDSLKNSSGATEIENKLPYLTSDERSESNSKKALNMLIEHFNGLVAFNEKGDLIDLSKRLNNVIAPSHLLK